MKIFLKDSLQNERVSSFTQAHFRANEFIHKTKIKDLDIKVEDVLYQTESGPVNNRISSESSLEISASYNHWHDHNWTACLASRGVSPLKKTEIRNLIKGAHFFKVMLPLCWQCSQKNTKPKDVSLPTRQMQKFDVSSEDPSSVTRWYENAEMYWH